MCFCVTDGHADEGGAGAVKKEKAPPAAKVEKNKTAATAGAIASAAAAALAGADNSALDNAITLDNSRFKYIVDIYGDSTTGGRMCAARFHLFSHLLTHKSSF